MPTFQINFSRPAGQVIAQYHEFVRLGREGYRKLHMASHANAQYFANKLREQGIFKVVHDGNPDKGIPTVVWTLDADLEHGFNLYDFADRLRMRGWQVPAYPFTGELESTAFQRILVKRDFSREMADLLLEDMSQAITHFQKHPITNNLLASEVASYNHL